MNVNLLGEAVLGDDEAAAPLRRRARLCRPTRRRLRVGQGVVGRRPARPVVARRQRSSGWPSGCAPLFTAARHGDVRQPRHGGVPRPRADARRRSRDVLDEPELDDVPSRASCCRPTCPTPAARSSELARVGRRSAARPAGRRLKVRLVKGANLAMEHVDAELHGWTQAPYATKAEVDANYKRLRRPCCCDRGRRPALRVGVASHNLFDVAWALTRRAATAASPTADRHRDARRAWRPRRPARCATRPADCCLYTPVVARRRLRRRDRLPRSAASRRTPPPRTSCTRCSRSPPDSPAFDEQADRVPRRGRATAPCRRRRRRGRTRTVRRARPRPAAVRQRARHRLRPPGDRAWIADGRSTARADRRRAPRSPTDRRRGRRGRRAAPRAAQPGGGRATPTADAARRCAPSPTRSTADRGDLVAEMADEAGKTVAEGDPEVSEAVDFAALLRRARSAARRPRPRCAVPRPLGVVVVAPPWNFPVAIPLGGVLRRAGRRQRRDPQAGAADAAVRRGRGRRQRARRGRRPTPTCCSSCACPDDDVGRRLVTHPDVDARRAHRLVSRRRRCSSAGGPTSTARRDERQERARRHRRRRPRPGASPTSCARRSGTPARSARRRSLAILDGGRCTTDAVPPPARRRRRARLRVGPADRPRRRRWAR